MRTERSAAPIPAAIPVNSLIFGYGPMVPFVLGAIGSWGSPPLRGMAIGLTVIWGGLILSFVGGVRRGYGFGNQAASTRGEIVTMTIYVSLAGVALICGWLGWVLSAIVVLAAGFIIVPIADGVAARAGDAPGHFARLRPPQMAIAVISLITIILRLTMS